MARRIAIWLYRRRNQAEPASTATARPANASWRTVLCLLLAGKAHCRAGASRGGGDAIRSPLQPRDGGVFNHAADSAMRFDPNGNPVENFDRGPYTGSVRLFVIRRRGLPRSFAKVLEAVTYCRHSAADDHPFRTLDSANRAL
jgi:hypothetical protein